ncbi:MAG: TatD family hydrolase [Bacteroidia bacterium]
MNITDTHTHLYAEEFNPDRNNLITDAINKGVKKFFVPNIDSTSFEGMYKVCDEFPENCFPMMGLHPCSVKENYKEELTKVENEFAKGKFYAVGEIGIDLYWDKTFVKEQEEAFITQCSWASAKKLPVVIHSREATNEIITILKKNTHLNSSGIFHCFSGTVEQASEIIRMGFYLGIGGVVTYKNSGLDKVVEKIDLKHLVVETDAPYLAPAPFRGKRNEPAFILQVVKKIAEIKNIEEKEVARVTSENAERVFGLQVD